jgi:hypothetical protein
MKRTSLVAMLTLLAVLAATLAHDEHCTAQALHQTGLLSLSGWSAAWASPLIPVDSRWTGARPRRW